MKAIFVLCLFFASVLFAAEKPCPFCNPAVVEKQFIHETDCIVTLYCLTPATKGNILIIPKRHVERFEQLSTHEMALIQSEINLFSKIFTHFYGIPEFVIIQKNGKNAGQSVAHVHFHMIPAPKPFDEIVHTAFHLREKISDEEMRLRTHELQDFVESLISNKSEINRCSKESSN